MLYFSNQPPRICILQTCLQRESLELIFVFVFLYFPSNVFERIPQKYVRGKAYATPHFNKKYIYDKQTNYMSYFTIFKILARKIRFQKDNFINFVNTLTILSRFRVDIREISPLYFSTEALNHFYPPSSSTLLTPSSVSSTKLLPPPPSRIILFIR